MIRFALIMGLLSALSLGAMAMGCDDDGGSSDGDTDTDTDTDADSDTDTDIDTDADAGPDGGDPSDVMVWYQDDEIDVLYSGLTTESINSTDVYTVEDIISEAGITTPLAELELNFEASDGWTPLESGGCAAIIPIISTTATSGGLDPTTNDMVWDSSLALPGCMGVDVVAVIHVLDVITVVRGTTTTAVPLAGLTTTDIGGQDMITLATIVAEADATVVLADVDLELVASDGWSPENSSTCEDIHPIDGANAIYGGVDLTTHDMSWDSTPAYPGCMNVNDLKEITIVE